MLILNCLYTVTRIRSQPTRSSLTDTLVWLRQLPAASAGVRIFQNAQHSFSMFPSREIVFHPTTTSAKRLGPIGYSLLPLNIGIIPLSRTRHIVLYAFFNCIPYSFMTVSTPIAAYAVHSLIPCLSQTHQASAVDPFMCCFYQASVLSHLH